MKLSILSRRRNNSMPNLKRCHDVYQNLGHFQLLKSDCKCLVEAYNLISLSDEQFQKNITYIQAQSQNQYNFVFTIEGDCVNEIEFRRMSDHVQT